MAAIAERKQYSQYDEERYILEAIGSDHGRFLDIGAWDGKTFSNSLALIEREWAGLLIEPSPESFIALLKLHGGNENLTLIHAAVGFDRHMTKFWNTPDAVSTTNEANYKAWQSHAAFNGCFYVPMITLEEIINQFGGPFDFVSIDTEGTSVELFSHLLDLGVRPRCICVEHDQRVVEVLQAGQVCGYKATYTNGTNTVLIL